MQLQMRRSSEQMGRETVQAVWERLHKGFILIDQRQLDSAGWMELYNMVHFFFACEKKEGTEERRELYSLIVSFFESMCLLHCQQLNELPADAAILPEYVRRWKHYAGTARAVRGVCAYMHRFFLPACKLHDVFLMALIKWRACCFMGLEQRLFEELVTLLRNKKGEQSHSMYICQQGDDSAEDLLSGLAQSFANLNVREHTDKNLSIKLHANKEDQLVQQHIQTIIRTIQQAPLSNDSEAEKKRLFVILSSLPDDDLVNKFAVESKLAETSLSGNEGKMNE
ncbi:Cullin-1 [Balamuthia mandrillaris]